MNVTAKYPIGLGFEDGWRDLSLVGPALFTVLGVFVAANVDGVPAGLLTALIGLQCVMLALGAAMASSSAAVWIARWTERVAPSRGVHMAGRRMARQLMVCGSIAVVGPLALALALRLEVSASPSLAQILCTLLAALVPMAAAQLLGAWCGLSWRGKAAPAVLIGWLVLAAALAELGPLRQNLAAFPALAVVACAAITLGWLALARRLPRQQRVWRGIPVYRSARASRLPAAVGWQRLPFDGETGPAAVTGLWRSRWFVTFYLPGTMLSQVVVQPKIWALNASGQHVQDLGIWGYAGWMALLTVLGGSALVHPGLHWRHRLAPGARDARKWGLRMLAGSLLGGMAWLVAVVAVVVALGPAEQRAALLSTGPVALGDLALSYSLAAWARGYRNKVFMTLMTAATVFMVSLAVTSGLAALGSPLVRGAAWLAVELTLAGALFIAALRRWAKHDLNALAEFG